MINVHVTNPILRGLRERGGSSEMKAKYEIAHHIEWENDDKHYGSFTDLIFF